MKTYKKIMNGVAMVEKLILVLATILIVVLTVGNVLSRKLLHQSWSFTEELVVAVFVLITLMAAALAARDGELVNLSLIPDRLSVKGQKVLLTINTVLSVAFTAVLFKYGLDKVITQLENGKRTFVLNWPEWIFWSFVPIGAACMVLHIIEYFVDYCAKSKKIRRNRKNDKCSIVCFVFCIPDPWYSDRNLPWIIIHLCDSVLRYFTDDRSNKYVFRHQQISVAGNSVFRVVR